MEEYFILLYVKFVGYEILLFLSIARKMRSIEFL